MSAIFGCWITVILILVVYVSSLLSCVRSWIFILSINSAECSWAMCALCQHCVSIAYGMLHTCECVRLQHMPRLAVSVYATFYITALYMPHVTVSSSAMCSCRNVNYAFLYISLCHMFLWLGVSAHFTPSGSPYHVCYMFLYATHSVILYHGCFYVPLDVLSVSVCCMFLCTVYTGHLHRLRQLQKLLE